MNNIRIRKKENHKYQLSSHSDFANARQMRFETYNFVICLLSLNNRCISSACLKRNCVDTSTGIVIFDLQFNSSQSPTDLCISEYGYPSEVHSLPLPWNLFTNQQ